MTIESCIRGKFPDADDLSSDEIQDAIRSLELELKRRRPAASRSAAATAIDNDLFAVAEELAGTAQYKALIARRNAAFNVQVRRELMALSEAAGSGSEALKAAMGGLNRPLPGGRLSAAARSQARQAWYLGGMIADLRRAGLMEYLTRRGNGFFNDLIGIGEGPIDEEIAVELWALTTPGAEPGLSGSQPARQIAEIMRKYQELARREMNDAGGAVREMLGWIVSQSHDPWKLRRRGYEAWRDTLLTGGAGGRPLLDLERTIGDRNADEFLRAVYDGLATGEHLRATSDAGDPTPAFRGPGNVAKRVSQSRVLHFQDATAWYQYNRAFGTGSVVDSVMGGLRHAAEVTALMHTFGPNPRAMLNDLRARFAQGADFAEVQRLRDPYLDALMDQIDGTARIPEGSLKLARWSAIARAVITMSKLGGAVISSITDVPVFAREMRYQGQNTFEAYLDSLRSIGRGRGSGDERLLADVWAAGLDGSIGDVAMRFSSMDEMPGIASKAVRLFMKLNLLSWWTDAQKTGAGLAMARWLGQNADRGLDALPEELRRMLGQFGIDAADWDAIRTQGLADLDGRAVIAPDRLDAAADADRATQRSASQLREKVHTLFADRIDHAVLTPGVRERALMMGTDRPGTAWGEFRRFFWQFKAFPVTLITRAWGREVYGHGAKSLGDAFARGQGDFLGMAHLIASMTVMGYAALALKDIAKGREPRDPNDGRTWVAAFVQGGGAGIFGDFLFAEYNRFGGGGLETLAGPGVGTVGDFARLMARIRDGEDAGASAFNLVKNNTPFLNLFYTRTALDYLVLYQISEMLNPGYLRRMERRMAEERGQTFIVPPSQVIPHGG